jgi:hypothetical protein
VLHLLRLFVGLSSSKQTGNPVLTRKNGVEEVGFLACIANGTPLQGEHYLQSDQSLVFGIIPWAPVPAGPSALSRYMSLVKERFMTGLTVLAIGCLLFWPSGVKRSFGGFCGSMFVVGAGLSTLETAADAFLSICGPPRYSEIRLPLGSGQ